MVGSKLQGCPTKQDLWEKDNEPRGKNYSLGLKESIKHSGDPKEQRGKRRSRDSDKAKTVKETQAEDDMVSMGSSQVHGRRTTAGAMWGHGIRKSIRKREKA